MKQIFLLSFLFFNSFVFAQKSKIALVIHGGAGVITKQNITAEDEKNYQAKLQEALEEGYQILEKGGSSLDAVVASIKIMEDSPLFNAGKGAVFNSEGKNELDAAIMQGKDLQAGAVAGLKTVKNPIEAAKAVMEKSKHVMMVGEGAEQFAKEKGLEIVSPDYFYDQNRYDQLKKIQLKEAEGKSYLDPNFKYGTVGAVALDQNGNITAGTSTGGMTNKKFGRVGDTPIIGAGTYADAFSGISCTGHGEFFIRGTAASSVATLIKYKKMKVQKAAQMVIDDLDKMGGKGGLIALDKNGNVALPFSTEGMYRAYIDGKGKKEILIYGK